MYCIAITVFEYRYNCIEWHIRYTIWYNMDSLVNGVYCDGVNCCLSKTAIHVMCSVLHIHFFAPSILIRHSRIFVR